MDSLNHHNSFSPALWVLQLQPCSRAPASHLKLVVHFFPPHPSYIYCESGIQYFCFYHFVCFFLFYFVFLVFWDCKQTRKEENKEKQTFPFKVLDLAAHHIDEREGIPLSVLRYGTCQLQFLPQDLSLLSCCPPPTVLFSRAWFQTTSV